MDRLRESLRTTVGQVAGWNAFLALLCCAVAWLNYGLAAFASNLLLAWLPFGVAMAGLMLWGKGVWPGALLGMALGHVVGGLPWMQAWGMALADVAGLMVARVVLLRVGLFHPSLERVRDVLSLFYGAALAGAMCSASLGTVGLVVSGATASANDFVFWWRWWLRDCLGTLLVTPLMLTWARGWNGRLLRLPSGEVLVWLVLLLGAVALVFGVNYPSHLAGYSVGYVVFVFSIWSALRFGLRGAAAAVFVVGGVSFAGTAHGLGPMVVPSVDDVALLWSVYNGVFAVTTLVLAAAMSERRRGQEALQASQARYRHLFSHAPIAILEEDFSQLVHWVQALRLQGITDLQGYLHDHPQELECALSVVSVTDINDISLKMFEAEHREQLLGPLAKTVKRDTRRYFIDELQALWEGRTGFRNEVSAHTLKGRRIDYLVHWDATTQNGQADWSHVIVAIMDITERSQLRDEFRQAQKMEAVGRLAGGIAHDFNNLIMIIQGYCSLLRAELGDDSPHREETDQIQKAANRAAALTRQLLAFSRKQVMKPKVLDLNTVVSEMNTMLRRLIGEHIVLNKRLAPNLRWVKADPGQLEQVVVNLAVNARDAMPEGGELTLETANAEFLHGSVSTQTGELAAGRYVMLAVTDTGFGMEETVKAHLFEPFFTTKAEGLGTGLGLSTVYGIVKQSGGEISVDSEPGLGTTIRIYLPCAEGTDASRRMAQPAPPLPRGTETVLVVEDEDLVRETLCKCLDAHGYHVLEASSGPAALRLAEKAEQIDLLITDFVMPEMNGRELAEHLLQTRPDLRIIVHSGYTDTRSLLKGIQARGGVTFMEKPFSPNDLLLRVRQVLDVSSPDDAKAKPVSDVAQAPKPDASIQPEP